MNRMPEPIYVNQSTTLVQVNTPAFTTEILSSIVLLSSITSPGSLVTIRDMTGKASQNSFIFISTTQDVRFLDNTTSISITQPFGFVTLTPQTPVIWTLVNTFGFPEQEAAVLLNTLTVNYGTVSNFTSVQSFISSGSFSTISSGSIFVQNNLSVGQSTISDTGYFNYLYSSTIITNGTIQAGTISTTRTYTSSIKAIYAEIQQSTGFGLILGGGMQAAGSISTLGGINIGGNVSTTSNLAVGKNLNIYGNSLLQGNLSTIGYLGVGGITQFNSTLQVKDKGYFYSDVYIGSNIAVTGSAYFNSSITSIGDISTASSIFVSCNAFIGGLLTVTNINADTLTLNSLSVIKTATLGNLSTLSSVAIGKSLQVLGSTLFYDSVSTLSNVMIGGNLSTIGELAVGGKLTMNNLVVQGNLSSMSNVYIRGFLSTTSSVVIGESLSVTQQLFTSSLFTYGGVTIKNFTYLGDSLSTIGSAAFFSSMQIQGGLSVFSSVAVSCNLDVGGTVTLENLKVSGKGFFPSIDIQTSTIYSLNVGGSTIHAGSFSTLGNIDMGGRLSTTNYIVTGSTLFAQNVTSADGVSCITNLGVGSNAYILFSTITRNLNTSNLTASNANLGPTYFNNGFSGNVLSLYEVGSLTVHGTYLSELDARFNGNVKVDNTLTAPRGYINTVGSSNIFTSTLYVFSSMNVQSSIGVNCNFPSYTLDVNGTINASQNMYVNGIPVLTGNGGSGLVSGDLVSTVKGLGSSGYVSSLSLTSTVQGLGTYYVSTPSLTSTVQGLGSLGYISSASAVQTNLTSTVQGLGTYYISTPSLTSTVQGLGSLGYISSASAVQTNLTSTVQGLGTYYVSTPSLTSTVQGLGTYYVSTPSLTSTVKGLGSYYVSSLLNVQSVSSLQGVFSSIYINTRPSDYKLDVNGPTQSAVFYSSVTTAPPLTITPRTFGVFYNLKNVTTGTYTVNLLTDAVTTASSNIGKYNVVRNNTGTDITIAVTSLAPLAGITSVDCANLQAVTFMVVDTATPTYALF